MVTYCPSGSLLTPCLGILGDPNSLSSSNNFKESFSVLGDNSLIIMFLVLLCKQDINAPNEKNPMINPIPVFISSTNSYLSVRSIFSVCSVEEELLCKVEEGMLVKRSDDYYWFYSVFYLLVGVGFFLLWVATALTLIICLFFSFIPPTEVIWWRSLMSGFPIILVMIPIQTTRKSKFSLNLSQSIDLYINK